MKRPRKSSHVGQHLSSLEEIASQPPRGLVPDDHISGPRHGGAGAALLSVDLPVLPPPEPLLVATTSQDLSERPAPTLLQPQIQRRVRPGPCCTPACATSLMLSSLRFPPRDSLYPMAAMGLQRQKPQFRPVEHCKRGRWSTRSQSPFKSPFCRRYTRLRLPPAASFARLRPSLSPSMSRLLPHWDGLHGPTQVFVPCVALTLFMYFGLTFAFTNWPELLLGHPELDSLRPNPHFGKFWNVAGERVGGNSESCASLARMFEGGESQCWESTWFRVICICSSTVFLTAAVQALISLLRFSDERRSVSVCILTVNLVSFHAHWSMLHGSMPAFYNMWGRKLHTARWAEWVSLVFLLMTLTHTLDRSDIRRAAQSVFCQCISVFTGLLASMLSDKVKHALPLYLLLPPPPPSGFWSAHTPVGVAASACQWSISAYALLVLSTVLYCDIFLVALRMFRNHPIKSARRAEAMLLIICCTITWTLFVLVRSWAHRLPSSHPRSSHPRSSRRALLEE